MNCLSFRNGTHEFEQLEPTAPPFLYPTQPPYNPDFMNEHVQLKLAPPVVWGLCEVQHHSGNVFIDGTGGSEYDESDEWGRRSLYEGVNCMPVSVLVCVQRAARSTLRLRITHSCAL